MKACTIINWEQERDGFDLNTSILSTSRPHLARQTRLEWDAVREQHMLLAPEKLVVLNQTAANVLRLCDGHRTVVEIVEELNGMYRDVAENEVVDLLTRLAAKRWVEFDDE